MVGDTASSAATFPYTPSAYQTVKSSGTDVFVAKLNTATTGNPSLVYATYYGGNGTDHGKAIAVYSGNAYITGSTGSSSGTFPLASAADSTLGGLQDAFVAKINPAAGGSSDLIYSTFLGGAGRETGYGIALDGSGLAHVTGESNSAVSTTDTAKFIVTGTPIQSGNDGGYDVFVAKYSSTGSLSYSIVLGGTGDDTGYAITLDSGKILITGQTGSTDFDVTSDRTQLANEGGTDAFVTKIDTSLSGNAQLVFSTYHGGTSTDAGRGIAVSGSTVYFAGFTESPGDQYNDPGAFPVVPSNAFQNAYQGGFDAFAAKITSVP